MRTNNFGYWRFFFGGGVGGGEPEVLGGTRHELLNLVNSIKAKLSITRISCKLFF